MPLTLKSSGNFPSGETKKEKEKKEPVEALENNRENGSGDEEADKLGHIEKNIIKSKK